MSETPDQKPEKLSYFRAMAGCFSGTAVFDRLIRQSMIRTVLHTAITVILLGIFAAVMQRSQYAPRIDEAAGYFRSIFGGVCIDRNGIRPADHPEKGRYQLLDFGGLLVYAPSGMPVLPEKSTFRDYRFTLAWFPAGAVMAVPAGDDQYAVSVILPGKYGGKQELCKADELNRILGKTGSRKASELDMEDFAMNISPADLAAAARTAVGICLFLAFLGEAGIQIVLCLLIFVGFFSLTSGRTRTLRWSELVRIALYAGCPALLVAACFTAFDLTGILSFGTVYVIGTIGFFLVIVNKMERSRHAGQA